MTAWILTDSKGIPFDHNMYSLLDGFDGFEDLGEDCKFYTTGDLILDNLVISRDDIFLGYCDTSRMVFRKLRVQNPPPIDYLPCLKPYLHREITETTIGDIIKIVESGKDFTPFFVKPADKQKLFTGKVINTMLDAVRLNDFDKDTKVWKCDVVDFITEFRCYINHWDIVDCKRYRGSYRINPNWNVLDEMLNVLKNEKMPITYCLDIGVLSTGETALVEINDGFAFGDYGLVPRVYASIMRDRWYEIVNGEQL